MAHFAEIDSEGIVKRVITLSNDVLHEPDLTFPETEQLGKSYISDVLGLSGEWLQTSYSGSFRGSYAVVGYPYDPDLDKFLSPGLLD